MNTIDYNTLLVDKENESVKYNDKLHKYWVKDTNQSCISVTTLIHKFQNFDEAFWCRYKALQKLVGEEEFDGPVIGKNNKRGPASPAKLALLDTKIYDHKWSEYYNFTSEEVEEIAEEILKEWAEKREASCIRGTNIHKQFELGHLSNDTKEIAYLNLGGSFQADTSNQIKEGKYIYPELLLSRISPDGKLRLAGQADLVIVDGFDVYILDYKSNRSIDTKSYYDSKLRRSQKLKYPLNDIDDCNFMHYTLQLSTYAWMIQKLDPRFNIKMLVLIHIDHDDNVNYYECEYIPKKVELMLSFYKKQLQHEEFKHSREKINF